MNEIAPEGQVFVCLACGKRSRDKYGDKVIDRGWDVSCVLNSKLCYEDKLELKEGRVVKIFDDGFVNETPSTQ
jgi:hypothetical protein